MEDYDKSLVQKLMEAKICYCEIEKVDCKYWYKKESCCVLDEMGKARDC